MTLFTILLVAFILNFDRELTIMMGTYHRKHRLFSAQKICEFHHLIWFTYSFEELFNVLLLWFGFYIVSVMLTWLFTLFCLIELLKYLNYGWKIQILPILEILENSTKSMKLWQIKLWSHICDTTKFCQSYFIMSTDIILKNFGVASMAS